MVYGTSSAPFLATRCLLQLPIDHETSHSNAAEVIKRDFYVDGLFFFGSQKTSKTLGLLWSCANDTFSFNISPSASQGDGKITKRIILAETPKIFDPLGLLSPVVVLAKMFLQRMWSLKIPWDSEIPQELASKWKSTSRGITP